MIKYVCDRCGKEITGNIGATADGICLCDECMNDDLTCGFKVGDEVITSTGQVCRIIDICTCDRCKEREFYEPTLKMDNGETEYIMISDKKNGFKSYYSIGSYVFGNLDEESVLQDIKTLRSELADLEEQLNMVKKLKELNKTK